MSPGTRTLKPKAQRHRRRLEVRYTDGLRPPRIGYSGNLSAGGMMIRTPQVLRPGTLLTLDLRHHDRTIHLRGIVVWARVGPISWLSTGRVGMGVRFIDPPSELATLFPGTAVPRDPGGPADPPGDEAIADGDPDGEEDPDDGSVPEDPGAAG